eukprot:6593909-Pyramimonas_sp.AAC.1
MVESETFPSFAKWRWKTLHGVSKSLLSCVESLMFRWDDTPFKKKRDAALMRSVSEAMTDTAWHAKLKFISWLAGWITDMQSWIGGCQCHQAEYEQGKAVTCYRKGRRLSEAWPYIDDKFNQVLREASGWTFDMFAG